MTEAEPAQELPAPTQRLLEDYTRALQSYLAGEGEAALHRAEELGRRAMAGGLEALEVAAVHHQAFLTAWLRTLGPEECSRAAKALAAFCASCPAWSPVAGETPEGADALEAFFSNSLAALARAQTGLRKALLQLNEVREQEARRIAHALHDEAAQLLASVHLELQEIARGLTPDQRTHLEPVWGLLDEVENQLRRLSHELRPTILDDLGLLPALEFLAQGVSQRTGFPITVDSNKHFRLPPDVETSLYRVVQEALNNISRHSRANRVTIRLRWKGHTVTCSIRDNGVGFEGSSVLANRGEGGFGLAGIRERVDALGGTLSIISSPGRGTELIVRLPLSK